MYLVSEEDELAEDGKGLEVLGEGPGVVPNEGAVEAGVEEERQNTCRPNQVVRFDCVQVLVVAALERYHDAVQDVAREDSGEGLLDLEDQVAGGVVGEVTLHEWSGTLKNMNSRKRSPKMMR